MDKHRLLLVDDDQKIISALNRNLQQAYSIQTACSGEEAIEYIVTKGPFFAVITDLMMPKMDGIRFLTEVKDLSPETVRIMLTGNADLNKALDAINSGKVFQLLTKPCPIQTLKKVLESALEQHLLLISERDLLNNTLAKTIQVFSEFLGLARPDIFGQSPRLLDMAQGIAGCLNLKKMWKLKTACQLVHLPLFSMPESLVEKFMQAVALTEEEEHEAYQNIQMAYELFSSISRMGEVAAIIKYQRKNFDGSGYPLDHLAGMEIPLESRIIRAVQDFDLLTCNGYDTSDALKKMYSRKGVYDPEIVASLSRHMDSATCLVPNKVELDKLEPGMIVIESIKSIDGHLLLPKGYKLTPMLCRWLKNIKNNQVTQKTVRIL